MYFTGKAGPYVVNVAIRPPNVVPGIAEVMVHVPDTSVTRVVVRPVFWRAGTKGAPTGDDAKPVKGLPGSYRGELWLMASGSYALDVSVTGPAGTGSVRVPVASLATGQLALGPGLTVLLIVLGTLLVAGVITAVYSANGESQVPPGETMSPDIRRRARRAAIIAIPALALIVFGGATWWRAEADRYRSTLYRPVPTKSTVTDVAGVPTLTLQITTPAWRARGGVTPVMPDHGKMAHMFIARVDSPFVFAHLHPAMPDRSTFTTPLPPLAAGRYRVFADIVHESGLQRTLVDSFSLAAPLGDAGASQLDADDAWSDDVKNRVESYMVGSGHDTTLFMRWLATPRPRANQTGVLRFNLATRAGHPVMLEPYLGMPGHAVVIRDDGQVFVHLHPSGTASMASQLAFALRDRGDTTKDGRLRLDSAPMEMMSSAVRTSEISFPYAFPAAGRYHVWVQVRVGGTVHTSGFNVTVDSAATR